MLGIDNVIFVSIILGRMPGQDRLRARRIWMIGGILLRSALLIGLGWLVKHGETALFHIGEVPVGLRDLIMFCGGLFLLYKAVKEIHEKLEGGEEHVAPSAGKKAFSAMVVQILAWWTRCSPSTAS